MDRQVLEAHEDDHAATEAEEDADQKQAVPVDGAVQKADRRKVRKFQRGFASGGFASGLSQSRGRADGEQRGQGERCFQETRYRTASLDRRIGGSGAYNESSTMSRFLGIYERVSRPPASEAFPSEHGRIC